MKTCVKSVSASTGIPVLADENLYPAILRMLGDVPPAGPVLDVPAGFGAFAAELVHRGWRDVHCLDIIAPQEFRLESVSYRQHDAARPLPYSDGYFDYVFSIEGIEHFESPWTFVKELCRVLRPGGRLFISTPNTFSVDARLKYLTAGYFPRFRPLMLEPHNVMHQPVDDAHIAPIYFWQLNFFLMQGGVSIERISTNAYVHRPQWVKRVFENLIARMIRNAMRRRGFPDPGVTSDEVLFGDCIILEGRKA
jgi:SAM-dependent methyltransferase